MTNHPKEVADTTGVLLPQDTAIEQMAHDIAILRNIALATLDFVEHHAIPRPRYYTMRRAVRRAEKDGVI